MIPSRDIDDKRILISDWTRDTPGQTQPRVVVEAIFTWYLSPSKKWLVLSCDIVDQRILQFDWTRDTTNHNQPNVVVSDAWWQTSCKKNKILTLSRKIYDPWILQSDWIWCLPSHTKSSGSLRCYLPLMSYSMHKKIRY